MCRPVGEAAGRLRPPDITEGLDTLLRALIPNGAVDVIGAALGSLAGALLAIRHPARVRCLMMCAIAADMAGSIWPSGPTRFGRWVCPG